MRRKLFSFFFIGIFLFSPLASAAQEPSASMASDEKLKIAREQIAGDAAFIRQINNNSKMTPDQKKTAIAEFIKKQNEKIG